MTKIDIRLSPPSPMARAAYRAWRISKGRGELPHNEEHELLNWCAGWDWRDQQSMRMLRDQ
jgi:hypothetical protein